MNSAARRGFVLFVFGTITCGLLITSFILLSSTGFEQEDLTKLHKREKRFYNGLSSFPNYAQDQWSPSGYGGGGYQNNQNQFWGNSFYSDYGSARQQSYYNNYGNLQMQRWPQGNQNSRGWQPSYYYQAPYQQQNWQQRAPPAYYNPYYRQPASGMFPQNQNQQKPPATQQMQQPLNTGNAKMSVPQQVPNQLNQVQNQIKNLPAPTTPASSTALPATKAPPVVPTTKTTTNTITTSTTTKVTPSSIVIPITPATTVLEPATVPVTVGMQQRNIAVLPSVGNNTVGSVNMTSTTSVSTTTTSAKMSTPNIMKDASSIQHQVVSTNFSSVSSSNSSSSQVKVVTVNNGVALAEVESIETPKPTTVKNVAATTTAAPAPEKPRRPKFIIRTPLKPVTTTTSGSTSTTKTTTVTITTTTTTTKTTTTMEIKAPRNGTRKHGQKKASNSTKKGVQYAYEYEDGSISIANVSMASVKHEASSASNSSFVSFAHYL